MKRRIFIGLLVLMLLLTSLVACKKKEEPVVEEPVVEEPVVVEVEPEPEPEPEEEIEEEPEVATHPLVSSRYPWAIMLDNHPDARPHSGLSTASLVYEILVEGRITRLLAITEDESALIGPIRSARPAFFDHVLEWQAFYAHVGNYEYVLQHPHGSEIKDMDQFNHAGNAYYRERHKVAPHNMYSHMDDFYIAAEREGYDIELPEEGLGHFQQYEEYQEHEGGSPATMISFSYDNYTSIDYRWDEETQFYHRYINGRLIREEFQDQTIEIGNLIILPRPHGKMPNGIHERVNYVGEGTATYFTGGQTYELTWEKDDHKTPIKYFLDGEELILNPGLTFINVVPDNLVISVNE